jgi:preprotein translocase subunit SecD
MEHFNLKRIVAVCLLILLQSFKPLSQSQVINLKSGWYNVSENGPCLKMTEEETTKSYYVLEEPIVGSSEIKSMEVKMSPKVNNRSYPEIDFEFKPTGAQKLRDALSKCVYKRQIGLIVNDKLRLVATGVAPVAGSKISISSSMYSIEALERLKKEITNSKF